MKDLVYLVRNVLLISVLNLMLIALLGIAMFQQTRKFDERLTNIETAGMENLIKPLEK